MKPAAGSAMARYGYQIRGAIRMLAGKHFGDREAPKTAQGAPGGGGGACEDGVGVSRCDTATKAHAPSEC